MAVPGWACFDGIELGNRAQTLTYLRNGLAGMGHSVPWDAANDRPECSCWVQDEAQPAGGWVDPATDGAVWYTPELPDSAEFLGLYIVGDGTKEGIVGIDAPPFERSVRQTSGVGGRLGPLLCPPRPVTITGYMVASSVRGLEYGKRWLNDVLQGCQSGDCGLAELCLYPVCPPEPYTHPARDYQRTLYRTGLTAGPFYDQDDCIGPNSQRVTFQLASEVPWLYLEPETLLDCGQFDFDPATPDECLSCCTASCCATNCGKRQSLCQEFETTRWVRESTVRIIIEVGQQDATNLHLTVGTNPPNLDQCPGCKQCDEDWLVNLVIEYLPAGSRLVIDGATRDIYIADANNCKVSDGFRYVEPLQPFESVPDVAPCARVCVCVSAHENCIDKDTLKVTIQRIDRES